MLSPYMSKTFLSILAVPNKTDICIIPTISLTPNVSIHPLKPLQMHPQSSYNHWYYQWYNHWYNHCYYYYYHYYYSIANLSQNQSVGRMIPVIQSQDIFPFSGEQECCKMLKIMCGYKSRNSQIMLKAAIQKEYTIVCFIQLKLKIQF